MLLLLLLLLLLLVLILTLHFWFWDTFVFLLLPREEGRVHLRFLGVFCLGFKSSLGSGGIVTYRCMMCVRDLNSHWATFDPGTYILITYDNMIGNNDNEHEN